MWPLPSFSLLGHNTGFYHFAHFLGFAHPCEARAGKLAQFQTFPSKLLQHTWLTPTEVSSSTSGQIEIIGKQFWSWHTADRYHSCSLWLLLQHSSEFIYSCALVKCSPCPCHQFWCGCCRDALFELRHLPLSTSCSSPLLVIPQTLSPFLPLIFDTLILLQIFLRGGGGLFLVMFSMYNIPICLKGLVRWHHLH